MKVASVSRNVSFGRALTNEELREYNQVLKKGKEAVGQTGKSIFIMPTQSLPQNPNLNTGIASISSDTAQDYIKFMHSMLDFNILEDLPPGQVQPYSGNFHCSYRSTSLALGDQHINPELLTKSELTLGKFIIRYFIPKLLKLFRLLIFMFHSLPKEILLKSY